MINGQYEMVNSQLATKSERETMTDSDFFPLLTDHC